MNASPILWPKEPDMADILSKLPDTPTTSALVRGSRVALAQGAGLALQTFVSGLVSNPVTAPWGILVGAVLSSLSKGMRDAGKKAWFWQIF